MAFVGGNPGPVQLIPREAPIFNARITGQLRGFNEKQFYSNIENLFLWARSKKIGFAVNECHGVLARPGATYGKFITVLFLSKKMAKIWFMYKTVWARE